MLNCISPKDSVVLTSRTSECHFIGRQSLTEIIKLKWGHQSECSPPGPVSLQKEETYQACGREPCEDEDKSQYASTGWGMPEIGSRPTRSMRGLGQTSSQPLEGTNPTDLLISNFQHQNRWVKQPSLWNFVTAALQMTTEVFSVKFPMWWEF